MFMMKLKIEAAAVLTVCLVVLVAVVLLPHAAACGAEEYKPARKAATSATPPVLKIVKPGESIQAAIDSLPPEGGIVQLAAGTFEIKTPCWINKSNVVLRGQGPDKTLIKQLTPRTSVIVVGKHLEWFNRCMDLAFQQIGWGTLLKWFQDRPDDFVSNVTVEKLGVFFTGSGPAGQWERGAKSYTGIAGGVVKNLTVSEVNVTAKSDRFIFGMYFAHFIDVTVRDSTVDGAGTLGHGMFFGFRSFRANAINNTILRCSNYSTIEYNGVAGLEGKPAIIRGNKIADTGGSLHVYSCNDVVVDANTVENALNNNGGILISGPSDWSDSRKTARITVTNNVVKGQKAGPGIFVDAFYPTAICEVKIEGNIVSNGEQEGLRLQGSAAVALRSNTIYGNGSHGVNNNGVKQLAAVNNIVVGNKGAGINGASANSYNDVWNNAGGDYKGGAAAGNNSISVDPLFADPTNGDFHLRSKAGRWDPKTKGWVKDNVTSPCIDTGDPKSEYKNEPSPNGGRINMGAHGNTAEASKPVAAKERE